VKGFAALPISIPGTSYSKALKARDSLIEMIGAIVRNHQEHRDMYNDGLRRLLDAIENEDKKQNRTANDTCLPIDILKLELLHFLLAANPPLCTLIVYLAYELTRDGGKLRDQIFEEIRGVTENFTKTITLSLLKQLQRTGMSFSFTYCRSLVVS
jgi:hypothetical protein